MKPFSETVRLHGHIIDSWILPRAFDTIMDLGGEFELEEIRVGRRKDEPSTARLRIFAEQADRMHAIVEALQALGAELLTGGEVRSEPAPADGVLPDDFYSTTNLPTEVFLASRWIEVADTEMDLAIVLDRAGGTARMVPMIEVRAGQDVVVGHEGIRVTPLPRAREREVFSFMSGDVSSERPKRLAIARIAAEMRQVRQRGGRILLVAGPAIVHSGAGPALERIIRAGFINVLFGGNAIAAHDIEAALFGTSLGVALHDGIPVEGGHRHHMRAINAIRLAGGLGQAVEKGVLRRGIMYEAIKAGIPMVLAGSVRDDGPIPDVVTDILVAQRLMREQVRGVEIALMVSTMLHSIATGNLLPARVKTVAVDINPAVVTKLADRGTFQAIGLVTDAELFLRELAAELGVNDA